MLSPLEPMFATTYTWTQANSTDFTDAGNWSPNRTVLAATDVLVFSGAFTPTATVTNIPSQTIAEMHAQGNVTANLTPGAGVVALSIAGGAAAVDLEVASGSALNITGGTTTTNTLLITLGVSANGIISGNMTFSGAQHSLQAASATGITFNSGATFTQGTLVTGNVFGSGTANSIVFASGSTFNQLAGSNPFQGLPNCDLKIQQEAWSSHDFNDLTLTRPLARLPPWQVNTILHGQRFVDGLVLQS